VALFGAEFIAVPDSAKGQIVFKWPDISIRRFTRAIVNADEVALFVNTGKVAAIMPPGRHQVDADELPGLGVLIDMATGGRAYRAELYFVGTREFTGFTFGGRIDDVQDPQTGLIVTLRVFGDYALRITDPVQLITNLLSTVDVTNNDLISRWVSDQLLKVMRTDITRQIVRNGWPILGLSAYTPEIEETVISRGNEQLAAYGVAISRMGNFDVNLSPDDSAQLKTLAKDTSYSRLAGGFNQYAAGEMALGAGAGMAQGGGAVSGAFLAAGLGAGGQLAAPYPPAAPPPAGFAGGAPGGYLGPPPRDGGPGAPGAPGAPAGPGAPQLAAAGVACASCGHDNPAGARFCMGCGQPVAAAPAHCTGCGAELAAGARFCPSCGTPAGAAPAIAATPPPAPPAPPGPSGGAGPSAGPPPQPAPPGAAGTPGAPPPPPPPAPSGQPPGVAGAYPTPPGAPGAYPTPPTGPPTGGYAAPPPAWPGPPQ
jgi:membrane protease subunit (stomatin/prohibitin family)